MSQQIDELEREEQAHEFTPNWREPEKLDAKLLPVPVMRKEMLPEPLRARAVDISHRNQVPLDWVAIGLMMTVATAVGAGCAIRPKRKDSWEVVPNLFGAIVGEPGSMKSSALKQTMAPLFELQKVSMAEGKSALKKYALDKDMYEKERAMQLSELQKEKMLKPSIHSKAANGIEAAKFALQELKEPEAPKIRRFITQDATKEKLVELLQDNPRGLMIYRDELVELLEGWNGEGRKTDRQFFLQAWDGDSHAIHDRVTRGTTNAENVCLSLVGSFQPDTLKNYLINSLDRLNDGLLQRFQLLSYPDPVEAKWIDEEEDLPSAFRADRIIKELANMRFEERGAEAREGKRPVYRFDDEAQILAELFFTELQTDIKKEPNPYIKQHLNKYKSLMPSLALLFHLCAVGDTGIGGRVKADCVKLAGAWCAYFARHARRVYGLARSKEAAAAITLMDRIETGRLRDFFTARQVRRFQWSGLTDSAAVQEAINELIDLGWVQPMPQKKGARGTKTRFYIINPRFKERG